MIVALSILAVGTTIVPCLGAYLNSRHLAQLTEQNQILVAALMATKNSPYAAVAAEMARPHHDSGPGEPLVPGLSVDPKDRVDMVGGAKLLGT